MINYKLSIEFLLFYLLLIGLISSCYTKPEVEKNDFLKRISGNLKLELVHMDSEYGEWGGDISIIKIYREHHRNHRLIADLIKVEGQFGPPPAPTAETHIEIRKGWSVEKSRLERKNKIELSGEDLELIENAILNLTEYTLNSGYPDFYSGNWNQVFLNDSSLIINEYSSFNWPKFQELKSNLENKK